MAEIIQFFIAVLYLIDFLVDIIAKRNQFLVCADVMLLLERIEGVELVVNEFQALGVEVEMT